MICVECGIRLESEALYIEYSERNIKLMRCVSVAMYFSVESCIINLRLMSSAG